jgi:hypothetical protein
MNKILTIIMVSLTIGILTYISNQYFEDRIMGQDKKILGISSEERFFLPFPKEYVLLSSVKDQRNTKIIISVSKPAQEIKNFYKEILRSKEFENDYEYEKDNIIEIRYLKESEDLKITITQEGETSIIEFNYHN